MKKARDLVKVPGRPPPSTTSTSTNGWSKRLKPPTRKAETTQDLQNQWIGHSSLRSGDRYSHTREEVEYRRSAAGDVGLDRALGPKQSQTRSPDSLVRPVPKPTS